MPPLLAPVQKTTLSLKMSDLKIDSERTDMVKLEMDEAEDTAAGNRVKRVQIHL